MIAKTSNIPCFVAKTHLSRFTHFFRQQMSPFNPFRGGRRKGTMSPIFTVFYIGASLNPGEGNPAEFPLLEPIHFVSTGAQVL